MKSGIVKNIIFASIYLLLVQTWTFAQAEISSAEISFNFVSKDVSGTIGDFQSQSTILPDDLTASKLEGSVSVESLKTGNFLRDWSLKSSKYFDEDKFPVIRFKSGEITKTTKGYLVKGALTIKETTKEVHIEFAENERQLIGSLSLYSSDYGIRIKSDREENLVRVKLVLELRD